MGIELARRAARCLLTRSALAATAAAALVGCHPDMWNQPRFTALQRSDFYQDGSASRGRVPGTVTYDGKRRDWSAPVFEEQSGARGVPSVLDARFYTGREGDAFMPENYFAITPALLERGRERFEITCTPCHGYLGDGTGVVTQRGDRSFPAPPSYHIDRLREVEDGYLFDVITNGFGRMYSHNARVLPEDRWAIVAYIRALQYSRNARLDDLTEEERERVLHPEKFQDNAEEAADHNAH